MSTLTLEKELELGRRIQQGDGDARNDLIAANLDVVKKILPKYASKKGVLVEDLIQEGNLGLLRASETYDPDFNLPFETHAKSWVKECMRMHVVNCGHAIRVPHQTTRKYSKIERFKAEFRSEHGRHPTAKEIAKGLGYSKSTQETVKECVPAINATAIEDDFLVPDDHVDDDEIEWFQSMIATVKASLDKLPYYQRTFLERFYNLDRKGAETLEELRERLEVRNMTSMKCLHHSAIEHLKAVIG